MNPPRLYLVSYKPLALTKAGREASARWSLPPFIDGSIRREPDLEHAMPSITCLCRVDKFTPHLRVDDVVGYFATNRVWDNGARHRRLTAILKVAVLHESHREAAAWYRERGLPLPTLAPVNPPSSKRSARQTQPSPACERMYASAASRCASSELKAMSSPSSVDLRV